MKDIYVCGRREIRNFIDKFAITHIISLHESRADVMAEIPREFRDTHLFIDMVDTDQPSVAGGPTIEDVRAVLQFVDEAPDDAVVLVHCEAGMSRSPAMFIAIDAHVNGSDIQRLWDHVDSKRSIIIPNELILRLASDLVEGNLLDVVKLNNVGRLLINANNRT